MNSKWGKVRWLVLALIVLSFSTASFSDVAVGISVRIAPPPLPVYAQPICPGPGYLWTPGYWAWDDDDGYYWVPGTWVVAPVGMLWTPGYWGWGDGVYLWHAGYWGPHIGFYGGINYGFGYTGVGFYGGEWRGGSFYYNRSVNNVSVTNITNVYNRTVIVNNTRMVSYNGGRGGIEARPSRFEERAAHEHHVAPLREQGEHQHMARQDRENFASQNHGRPAIAATARPADFSRRSAVTARAAGGEYHAPAMSPREARGSSAPHNNKASSREGFRSFNPPSKNGGSGGNVAHSNMSRPSEKGAQNRPTENRAQSRMSDSRPESRPNENRSQNRTMENRPTENRAQSRMNDSRPQSRPNQNRSENRTTENRPQSGSSHARPMNERTTSHAAPPRESAPKQNPHPAPSRQQSPPRDEHRRGR